MYFSYILILNWRPLWIEYRVGTSRVILLFEFGPAPMDGQGLRIARDEREEFVILSHVRKNVLSTLESQNIFDFILFLSR